MADMKNPHRGKILSWERGWIGDCFYCGVWTGSSRARERSCLSDQEKIDLLEGKLYASYGQLGNVKSELAKVKLDLAVERGEVEFFDGYQPWEVDNESEDEDPWMSIANGGICYLCGALWSMSHTCGGHY
jgi:hypothetical protein